VRRSDVLTWTTLMISARHAPLVLLIVAAVLLAAAAAAWFRPWSGGAASPALVVDARAKSFAPAPVDRPQDVTFALTNRSPAPVRILGAVLG
jgi:hypothetical protein